MTTFGISQNFLHSKRVLRELINASGITDNNLIIEIGGGKGFITKSLVETGREIWCYEIDPLMYPFLEKLNSQPNFKLIRRDFLTSELPQNDFKGEYGVFSNPPFNHTAKIMERLIFAQNPPSQIALFLQKEAVDRYFFSTSQISVLTAFRYSLKEHYEIDNSNFEPKPQVDVVFINAILRKPTTTREKFREYEKFIVYFFNAWQENVESSIKKLFTFNQIGRLKSKYKEIFKMKPSQVRFELWESLFIDYSTHVKPENRLKVEQFYKKYKTESKLIEKSYRSRTTPPSKE